MGAEIVRSGDCCSDCDDVVVSQVPGPPGADGANGADGTNGSNAYSIITSGFVMPAVGGTASVTIQDARWMAVGQAIYMFGIGYLFPTAIVGGAPASVTFENPVIFQDINAFPGTNAALNAKVSPSGYRGVQGVSPSGNLNTISPTTTKGDIIVDNGAASPSANDVRLGVGTDGQTLHARSTQPTGIAWATFDMAGTNSLISGQLPLGNGGSGQSTQQAAIDAFCNKAGSTKGDLWRYDGTNWKRFAIGTALQLLRTNSAADNIEWATPSGGVAQMVSANTNAYSLGSTIIPADDTIPQIGEGTELLNLTITPTTVASRLVITASVPCACGSIEDVTIALFVGGVSNSLGAVVKALGLNASTQIVVDAEYSPGAIAAKTISLRIGTALGAQWEVNGASGFRVLGGAQHAYLRVVEYP